MTIEQDISHTPAPWRVDIDSDEKWLGVWSENGCIAVIESKNTEPDARLIAAAPELLSALIELKEVMNDIATEQCEAGVNVEYWNRTTGYGFQVANRVSALISKATGQNP